MQNLAILGSTGSIGVNTLDVARRLGDRFRVFALAAGRNVDLLARQIIEFHPKLASVENEAALIELESVLGGLGLSRRDWPQLGHGSPARIEAAVAGEVDCVVSAIVGVAGLEATYEAARRGKRIGLANKETLVAGGALVTAAARDSGAEIIPIDSEHNGAHQCLRAGRRQEVARLILTASGGPFRGTPREDMAAITPRQALNHPTWKMGPRITVDSATLMNKGFEVIEASWLFGFRGGEVDVVIHPQSSVHAMVEYRDGSLVAQASATDMRMPIQYALTWPERLDAPVPRLEWDRERIWEFAPPDLDRFPLLRLSYEALEAGGAASCALNAADEVAVEAFLKGEIGFTAIASVVEATLARTAARAPATIGDVLEIDRAARASARDIIGRLSAAPVAGA
jgi:1-deoxy-D-xylulose-5-phosphate reductoisomerase